MTPSAIFIIRLVLIGLYEFVFFPYRRFNVADNYANIIRIAMTVIFIGMCVHLCLSVL
jgi:hypothetical protein